jgi:hypothetical protein
MTVPVRMEPGHLGTRAIVTGEWSPAVGEAIVGAGATELELNEAKGWRGAELQFLRLLPSLRELTILDHTIGDIEPIHFLGRLERVRIDTYCKTAIRFECFPNLRWCYLHWRRGAESLFRQEALEEVIVSLAPVTDLRALAAMRRLRSLTLLRPSRMESLLGAGRLTTLTHLVIDGGPRLANIEDVGLLNGLESLGMNTCRKVWSLDAVSGLRGLRELQVCNNGEIESFKALRHLARLERLLFYESTNVLDGELGHVIDLPKLKEVAFRERKHYSHTRADFVERGVRT